MNLTSLRDLIDLYRREGEIVEVTAPVDPYLEIAEIHRRVIAAGGPALRGGPALPAPGPLLTHFFAAAAHGAFSATSDVGGADAASLTAAVRRMQTLDDELDDDEDDTD